MKKAWPTRTELLMVFLMVMTLQTCGLLSCRAFSIHTVPLYDTLCFKFQISLSLDHLSTVHVSIDDVLNAIHPIKPNKVDSARLSAEHLRYSALFIAGPLSAFFTVVLHHGYMPKCMPKCIRNCPIPKNNKDPSSSKNYRTIAIVSLLSKVLFSPDMSHTLQVVLCNLASRKVI